MARRKSINPCINKGRDYGSKAQGRLYQDRLESKFQRGCECAHALVCRGEKARDANVLKFGEILELKNGEQLIGLSTKLNDGEPDSNEHPNVLPCAGRFLNRSLESTFRYRKLLRRLGVKKQELFPGCGPIEEELIKDHQIIVRPNEATLKSSDPQEKIERQGLSEDMDGMSDFEKLTYLGTASDKIFTSASFDERILDLQEESRVIEFIAGKENSVLATSDFKDLEALNDQVDLLDRKAEQAKILKKRLRSFKRVLTPKQRKAFELLWASFETGESRAELSRRLKISIDSFDERIEFASKKFSEFFDGLTLSSFKKKNTGSINEAEIQDDPIHRRPISPVKWWKNGSREPIIVIVTESNPRPFGEKRSRQGADEGHIKRLLKEEEFLKVKFLKSQIQPPSYESDRTGDKGWTAKILDEISKRDVSFLGHHFRAQFDAVKRAAQRADDEDKTQGAKV